MPGPARRRGGARRRLGARVRAVAAAPRAPRRRGVQHLGGTGQLRVRTSEARRPRRERRPGALEEFERVGRRCGEGVSRVSHCGGIALAIRGFLASNDRPMTARVLWCWLLLLPFSLSAGLRAEAMQARVEEDIPRLTAPVNDFANVVDAASEAQLDELIRRLQNATGDVMVVATVKTFQPFADLPSYAEEMFENGGQGIGVKGKDNGVLIVLAIDDRQVRVETGYGLEGFITDGFAGETSRSMVPFFREAEYGRGLVAGATRVAQRIAEGRNVDLKIAPPPQAQTRRRTGSGGFPAGFWIILIIIFLNMMRGGRRRRRWISGVGPFGTGIGRGGGWSGGGGFGGGFGGFGGGRSGGGGGGASW